MGALLSVVEEEAVDEGLKGTKATLAIGLRLSAELCLEDTVLLGVGREGAALRVALEERREVEVAEKVGGLRDTKMSPDHTKVLVSAVLVIFTL